ncbi:hypothetical protein, partial [Vibrio parahaemolyticus]|uniref:hypothetical protein n=1 Tax=Vibrio parahaemolyticus TaxID=670 RepID=UPI001C60BF5C
MKLIKSLGNGSAFTHVFYLNNDPQKCFIFGSASRYENYFYAQLDQASLKSMLKANIVDASRIGAYVVNHL